MLVASTENRTQYWNDLAAQFSVDSIRASTAANSGHPTSSMSAAHLASVLFTNHLRYNVKDPKNLGNDRFVLSKGHASPLLYSVYKAMGCFDDAELLSFRKEGSPLQGHPAPIPEMPWVDVATGSLGQGLPIGVGMALGLRMDHSPARVWVLMGDSETAEGSVWEAMEAASYHKLDNLVAIIDMNRLGQRGPTMNQWHDETYLARAKAFGWQAVSIDGHDVNAIDQAFSEAENASGPFLIVAKTHKGNGVSFLQDAEGKHGVALSPEDAEKAITELGGERSITFTPRPAHEYFANGDGAKTVTLPTYDKPVATRRAFGDTLAAMAEREDVVVLDAEVGNSTYTELFQKSAPDRFVEFFIAEQVMTGASVGLQVVGKKPFAATFGAFLTRAYDFVRMAAVSRASIRLCGSHAGVSIGEDGPSQMALEDLAMMRAVHGSTVLYPSDGNSTARLTDEMYAQNGIVYMRTTREATPILYGPDESFPVGGSKTLRSSTNDRVTLVGAGVTLHESLKAADALASEGIAARVIDLYSVKPIDAASLSRALQETGTIVITEDHWPEGGLGDAVLDALAANSNLDGRVIKLAVHEMPGSATADQQRAMAHIAAADIVAAAKKALS